MSASNSWGRPSKKYDWGAQSGSESNESTSHENSSRSGDPAALQSTSQSSSEAPYDWGQDKPESSWSAVSNHPETNSWQPVTIGDEAVTQSITHENGGVGYPVPDRSATSRKKRAFVIGAVIVVLSLAAAGIA